MFFVFFFSSRRRHTRYWRDWSSDVCSSDLTMGGVVMLMGLVAALLVVARPNAATFATLLLVSVVAGIGLYDDWQKISKKRPEDLSARYKFALLMLAVVRSDVPAIYYLGANQTVVVPSIAPSFALGRGIG